jgi:hypothetical protein
MTRFLTRSLLVVGLGAGTIAAGCGPSTPPEVGGAAGSGPVTNRPDMCTTSGANGGIGLGTGAAGVGGTPTTPQVGATHTAAEPPPAISGGTLKISSDGKTAVAADPDRDQVYVVDLPSRTVTSTVVLQKGDEPGRVTLDAAGRAHVALRHGGALVTIDLSTGTILSRRDVCAAPRGVAYDAANDLVHVACADGQLVSLKASGGAPTRTLQLDSDLRDVIVDKDQLRVTRFRSAEVLTVSAAGAMMNRTYLPAFISNSTRNGQSFTPSVAWRAVENPTGGVVMVHQRGLVDEVSPTAGGYGSPFNGECDAIVQTAVTTVAPGKDPQTGPAIAGMVVPADMAVSSDGSRIAIIAAGNATNSETPGGPPRMPRLFVTDMTAATDQHVGCKSDGVYGPCLPLGGFAFGPMPPQEAAADAGAATDPSSPAVNVPTTCDNGVGGAPASDGNAPEVVGQPIAVSFVGSTMAVAVQSREPAVLAVPGGAPIQLSAVSRSDTGHDLFHANAGSGIACASCHAEGTEDGRSWNFACEGVRRTQSLQVGLKGTEPFHWGGDEHDFSQLVQDVFVGRMSGPALTTDQINATIGWIDAQPRRTHTMPTDTAAVARGQAIFNDPTRAACATCHAGAHLTNNQTVDVGTGGTFQVPSLVGISTRGPFMHNGCAETLRDRFDPACGGGDRHGVTSKLKPAEVDDLVTYLETL